MKKLVMAVAIVCAAVASQAAQINWGNSSSAKIYALDGTTALKSGLNSFQIFLVDSKGTQVSSATMNTMSAGVLQNASYTYKFDTDYTTGDTFSILAKMTVDGKNYTMTITPANNAITAVNNTGVDSFDWTSGTYGGVKGTATAGTAGSWVAAEDPEPTPEPTSALMLLLGMAGLALRRKQA